jgi:hypothetical protein
MSEFVLCSKMIGACHATIRKVLGWSRYLYVRLNVLLLYYPWLSVLFCVSYSMSIRYAVIPLVGLEFGNELLHAAKKQDVYNTIRLLLENNKFWHANCQYIPSIMRDVSLCSTIRSHGLFSQMLSKKDVCTFVNELPHSYHFYLSGYVEQVWLPRGIQAKYHSGDVMLLSSTIADAPLVECKTVTQYQSRIPMYLKSHEHIKLSMGSYEMEVYDKFVSNCDTDPELKINFADKLLFDGKRSFFVIEDLDLTFLKNYIKDTARLEVSQDIFNKDDFLKKLKLR